SPRRFRSGPSGATRHHGAHRTYAVRTAVDRAARIALHGHRIPQRLRRRPAPEPRERRTAPPTARVPGGPSALGPLHGSGAISLRSSTCRLGCRRSITVGGPRPFGTGRETAGAAPLA